MPSSGANSGPVLAAPTRRSTEQADFPVASLAGLPSGVPNGRHDGADLFDDVAGPTLAGQPYPGRSAGSLDPLTALCSGEPYALRITNTVPGA